MSSAAVLELLFKGKDETGAAAESVKGHLGGVSNAARVLTGVLTGGAAASALGFLSDAARAAAADEASVLGLKRAVQNSGASWDSYANAIDTAIKRGQALAFSDDATRASLQSLTESTGSVDEAMTRLPIAMDLARAKHIDLEAAAKLVGKVSDENTSALRKYGISVDDGATATDVLAKVQQVAGGQAVDYGNSTLGMIDKTKDAFSEWKESVGAAMGPAQGVIALLPGMSSGMSLAGSAIGGVSTLIKSSMIPSLIAMAIPFAPLLIAIAAIGAAVAILKIAWDNDWGGIREKVQGVINFVTGIFRIFETEGLGGLLARIGEFVGSVPAKFVEMGEGIVKGVLDGLGGLKDAVLSGLRAGFEGIDFWVGPFHVTGRGISVQMPEFHFPEFHVPGLASGGIVTSPTLAIIGEREPEAVIPLSRAPWSTPYRGEVFRFKPAPA